MIPFPSVEPLVGRHRRQHDPVAALGVPAHVTVHFPWLPAAGVDDRALASVARLAGMTPRIPVTFAQTRWFEESVLWLAPEPDAPFRDLSERSQALWPEHPLYEGAFSDVVPHLTVGVVAEGEDDWPLRLVARDLAGALPVHAMATEVRWLVRGADGRWTTRRSFPLGG